jgi:hypothetical protein
MEEPQSNVYLKAQDLFKDNQRLPRADVVKWLQEEWNASPHDLSVILPFIAGTIN